MPELTFDDFRQWLRAARRDFAVDAVMEIQAFSREGVLEFGMERLRPALDAQAALVMLERFLDERQSNNG